MNSKLQIHQNIIDKLQYFYEIHKIPNILFHGDSGCGKRTVVDNFIDTIYKGDKEMIKTMTMYVNCAHGKGIKFIREDLKYFAKTHINANGGNLFKSINKKSKLKFTPFLSLTFMEAVYSNFEVSTTVNEKATILNLAGKRIENAPKFICRTGFNLSYEKLCFNLNFAYTEKTFSEQFLG